MKNLLIDSTIFNKKDLEFVDGYFSNWVSSIYFAGRYIFIDKFHKEPTYEEAIKIFLALFKRMIDDGLILAITPDCFYDEKTKTYNTTIKKIAGEKDAFWDVSSDEMIEYIRSVLPSDLSGLGADPGSDDDMHVKFWYIDCPGIRWVDKEDGKIC